MIATDVNGSYPKSTWEAVSIYRAPNEDMWLLETWQTVPRIWDELRSVASLEVV
jgi:hypothetical protein